MSKRYYIGEDGVVYSYEWDGNGNYIVHPAEDETSNERRPQESPPSERVLKRIGEARPPRKENVPIGMRQCPVCEALIPRSRLDEHMEKSHSEDKNHKGLETCTVCGAQVRPERLEKHLSKVHGRE